MKFPLISLTATLFHSSVRKNLFYSKNIDFACNFYGTDMYPPVCKCMHRRI